MPNKRSKLAVSFLVFLFTVGTFLAVSNVQNVTGDPDKVFILGMSENPTSVNPILSTSAYDMFAYVLVFDALIYADNDTWIGTGQYKPNLADKWTISEDNLTITFNLNTEAEWHDGEDFDSQDVMFTFDASFYSVSQFYIENTSLQYVHSYEAPDADTFVLHLTDSFAPIFSTLTTIYILPEHKYNTSTAFSGDPTTDFVSDPSFRLDEKPIGTGQYQFKSVNRATLTLTLEKYDNYHRGDVEVDIVKFVQLPSDAVRVASLEAGEIDFMDTVPGPSVPTLQENDDIVVDIVRPGGTFRTYTLNCYKEPWSVKEVRQGFQMNINRTYIIEYVMGGYAVTSNADTLPSSWAYPPDIEDWWPYNQTAALELWDSVGFVDGGLLDQTPTGDGYVATMNIMYNSGNTPRQQITDYMRTRFAGLPTGYKIDITVQAVTWLDIYADGMGVDLISGTPIYTWDPKSWDAYMVGLMATTPEPDNYDVFAAGDQTVWPPAGEGSMMYPDYYELFTPLGFQLPLWQNSTWEALTTEARLTFGIDERKVLYNQTAHIVAEEIPMGFLYYEDDIYAWGADWTGLDMGPQPFTIDLGLNLDGPEEEEETTMLIVGAAFVAVVLVAIVVVFLKRGAPE